MKHIRSMLAVAVFAIVLPLIWGVEALTWVVNKIEGAAMSKYGAQSRLSGTSEATRQAWADCMTEIDNFLGTT